MKFVRDLRVKPKSENLPELIPLTPSYERANHEVYLNAIESALTGSNRNVIRNIAVTGSYGVGKSSILVEVARRHPNQTVQISLSNLGLATQGRMDSSAAVSTTNQIQKEIVKQLLYREAPVKMPGSRYRRIERFRFWRGLWVASLVGAVLCLVFFLTGWTAKLAILLTKYYEFGLAIHIVVFLVACIFVLACEALFHDRIRIEKLSAGAATISLSGESATYFDEYLDEIVYFFDVTGCDLVVFEDIDRFDDPHIFETLRALNTLLNGVKQLRGRSIRFIYAIKDSIFASLGDRAAIEGGDVDEARETADPESARANRTKFFDLVIPVVPFITHRSARDLMRRIMGNINNEISDGLIDLAARDVADLRLIKNLCNEFVIFREKVLLDAESIPGLSEDQLFAMMLYKSTQLSDFEQIKFGQSKLDELYRASRDLVSQNIDRLNDEEKRERQRASMVEASLSRGKGLGDSLIVKLEQLIRLLELNCRSRTFNGEAVSDAELRSPEFWLRFLSAEIPLIVNLMDRYNYQQRLVLSRAELEGILGETLSLQDWQERERESALKRITEIRVERELLSHADMNVLMQHEEFKLQSKEDQSKSFRQIATQIVGRGLALKLVQAGYIDRNFTLYASTYYNERVSAQAMNFIIHNVGPNVTDAHFSLTASDVKDVLRECGDSLLRTRGGYNINLLDALLESDSGSAEILIQSLTAFGDDEQSFLHTYILGGKQRELMAQLLASRWQPTLIFITEVQVEDSLRLQLLNVALENLADRIDYDVNDAFRALIEGHYPELLVFTSDETTSKTAARIAKLLTASGSRLKSLESLGVRVKCEVIAANRYLVTRSNLKTCLGGGEDFALDLIKDHDIGVYDHVMNHLSEYLAARKEKQPEFPTVESPDAFAEIVKQVQEQNETLLPEVVALASPACQVLDLAEVPDATWPVLAEYGRFDPTFANVHAYVVEATWVDAPLGKLLASTGSIATSTNVEESEKQDLAVALLSANAHLRDPELRCRLVISLDLADRLAATSIRPEQGKLIGLLIAHGIIEDDADSFALALQSDWPTREFAISKSGQFSSYMTTVQVPSADLAPLMRSSDVFESVKTAVLGRYAEFFVAANRDALTAAADFANRDRTKLSVDFVSQMADAGVESQLLLAVLAHLLPNVTEMNLVPILGRIGGVYREVSQRGTQRPKLPNTGPNLALLNRLRELGIVSSFEFDGNFVRVHMKRSG